MTTSARTIPRLERPERLWLARKRANLGVSEMATIIGCSRFTITNYENGKTHKVSADVLAVWADACNVPLPWLISGVTTGYPRLLVTRVAA